MALSAVLLGGARILPEHLPPEVASTSGETKASEDGDVLADQEQRLILDALEQSGWNQSAAARALGVSRDILRSRVKRYGLRRPG